MGGYGGAPHRTISYARTKEWEKGHLPYKCCKGAHVVVTGGAIGIGFELAREAIARGAAAISLIDVADCSRAVAMLIDEAADGVSAVFRANIAAFKADVSDYEEVNIKEWQYSERSNNSTDVFLAQTQGWWS